MYVPAHFAMPDDEVLALLAAPIAGDLVTWSADHGLDATVVPFVHEPAAEGWGSLHGHLARANPQWRLAPSTAMVILRGPDGYVSPSWYATKREHGRVVPTWDYVVVNVHGELVIHDDPEHLRSLVARLTDRHESGRAAPWSVADAPADFVDKQLRAIVGIELRISRIEAKAKLSQNRSVADVDGVVAGLHEAGQPALARAVDGARPA
ncbi:MAG: FMN-binding negative transcriptional regulator [Acidimicrobiia bacterium]